MITKVAPPGLVSAVITTYNRPDYLYQALQSVQTQTCPIHEVIVVDDCSPTEPNSVLDKFADLPIVYRRLSINHGANYARNYAVSLASGDWIAFLDDDDAWLPDKLTRQFQVMGVRCDEHEWLGSLCSYRFLESLQDRYWGHTDVVELEVLKTGNPYCGASGLLVRKEIIEKVKFDETLLCGQDWDVFIRLSKLGALLYVQEPLLLYRRGNHDSVTLAAKKLEIADLPPRLSATYKHRTWMGELAFRQRIARQTLAYVWHKKHPLKWVRESIRLAGWSATCNALWSKFSMRFSAIALLNNHNAKKRKVGN